MSEHEQAPKENVQTYGMTWNISLISTAIIIVLVFGLYLLAAGAGFGAFFLWLFVSALAYPLYRLVRAFF